MKKPNYRCAQCYRIVDGDKLLTAPNPFAAGEIVGCPICKAVESMIRLCDVEGCDGVGGHYSSTGRFLCHKHSDMRRDK